MGKGAADGAEQQLRLLTLHTPLAVLPAAPLPPGQRVFVLDQFSHSLEQQTAPTAAGT